MDILEGLNWRYATKKFDTKKLEKAQIDLVLESLRLTASSYGLQPMHVVVVENPSVREELVGHSWGQKQVADASHLLVLCRQNDMTANDVDHYIATIVAARQVAKESLTGYSDMMKGTLAKMSEEQKVIWMSNQVYLALGNLLTVCAAEGIDACPMEGFDKAAYDRILKLEEKGLNSVVVCPVGYRSAEDPYAKVAKVRKPMNEVLHTI